MLLGTRIYYLLCTRYFYRNVTIDITELNHALHVFSILNEDVLGWGECSGFVDTKLLVLMRCAIDFQTLAQNHWLLQLPSFRVRSALSNHEEILSSCLASMHILTFKRLQFQHLEVHWISLGWLDTFKESVILDASYRYLYLSLVYGCLQYCFFLGYIFVLLRAKVIHPLKCVPFPLRLGAESIMGAGASADAKNLSLLTKFLCTRVSSCYGSALHGRRNQFGIVYNIPHVSSLHD